MKVNLLENISLNSLTHQRVRLQFTDWKARICEVYAECLIPEGESLPGIIHCVGGKQCVEFKAMEFWAKQGYACASFDWQIDDLPGRSVDRQSDWPAELRLQSDAIEDLDQAILPVAIQAARETLSWLVSHESVDSTKLGMSGISWGGYLTWLTAAYEPRIKAITPVYGCGIFDHTGTSRYGKMSKQVAEYWRANWDPQSLALQQTAAVCYLGATNDFFGHLHDAECLLKKLHISSCHSYLPNADHAIGPGESALASAWMAYHLKGSSPVPRAPKLSNDLTLDYDDSLTIQVVEFWFSCEANEVGSRNYCWLQAESEIPKYACRVFARIHYENGITLCSNLIERIAADPVPRLPETWSDLYSGIGWRWELGNVGFFENTVRLQRLDEGRRILIEPSLLDHEDVTRLFLRQLNHPGWTPSDGECIAFSLNQEGEQPVVQAIAWFNEEEKDLELDSKHPNYRILPPEQCTWAEVQELAITVHKVAHTFIFGPLSIASDK